MGINSTNVQPTWLSLSTTGGNLTFSPLSANLGYWSTQIKISDGLSYSVVEFIINVMVYYSLCMSF